MKNSIPTIYAVLLCGMIISSYGNPAGLLIAAIAVLLSWENEL